MTKKQCKNKIANLEDRIDRMQEQVIHYRRQVKVLDAEDSKRLLEKFHIESEELAELLMNRGKRPQPEPEPEQMRGQKPARIKSEATTKTEDSSEEEQEQIAPDIESESRSEWQESDRQEPEQQEHDQQEPEQQETEPEHQESHTSIMDAFRKEAEQ